MDIIRLLAGTAGTPPAGKPAGNAETGAQFASILEDATNVHGVPKGLTLLAAAAAPRTAATSKDLPAPALHAKRVPADPSAAMDVEPDGEDAPKTGSKDAPQAEPQDAQTAGQKVDGDDEDKHVHGADAAAPNAPIAAAISTALAAMAARNGQPAAGDAGKAAVTGQRADDAAPGKVTDTGTRGTGSRHQLQQLPQAAPAVTAASTPGHAGADPGASGNGQGLASQWLPVADASSHAAAPAHADNGTPSAAVNGLFSTNAVPQAATPASAPALVSTATLHAPVGSTPWQAELGQQLIRFSQRGDHRIELHLHPKDLGPLQISLHVNDQVAQAHFFAAHAQVRDAVQQAIPQLREALAGQGIALGEAMVGQQQQQRQDAGGFGASSASPSFGVATEVESIAPARPVASVLTRVGAGGVDLYA